MSKGKPDIEIQGDEREYKDARLTPPRGLTTIHHCRQLRWSGALLLPHTTFQQRPQAQATWPGQEKENDTVRDVLKQIARTGGRDGETRRQRPERDAWKTIPTPPCSPMLSSALFCPSHAHTGTSNKKPTLTCQPCEASLRKRYLLKTQKLLSPSVYKIVLVI